jgi:polar amino acid transport system substrate-binding protein
MTLFQGTVFRIRTVRGAGLLAGVLAAGLLAACSSSSGGGAPSGGGSSAGAGTTAAASAGGATTSASGGSAGAVALPSGYSGPLTAPAVVGYPPYAYVSGGKILGVSTDLATALGGPWGKSVSLRKDSFENSLLGVNRGTYFGVFGADVTADREKAFDQVSFLEDHYQFMSLASSPALGNTMLDLCGKKISLVAADSAIPVLKSESSKCTAAGKSAITVLTFADQGAATLAVQSKRADATTATYTNLGYIAKQAGGTFQVDGPKYQYVLIGIATKKGNGMAQSIADAINALIANGEYQKILAKYGVADAAVKKAEVNPNPTISGS